MPEKNILIADDDESIQRLFVEILKDEGYRIFLASDGKEAIEIVRKNPIDLAILDIRMPEMDGIEALKQIKAMDETIEVLIMTGYADLGSLKEILFDYGARDYLPKPFDLNELKFAVKRALRKREFVLKSPPDKAEAEDRILELERDYKRKTLQLRESQIKYRDIVENSIDAIVIIQDGYLKFANRKAVELSGYSKEEILRMPFERMIHPDDAVEVTERYTHRINGKDIPTISTFRVVRKDGSFFWIETNAVITLWEEKPAILNILRDISQRLADEEAMVRSEKLASLGQLSAGLAHELRNPLAVISSCSQFCLENMKLEQLVRENFQVIYRNSQRASRLISELLAFARPGRFEREEVDVNELVSRMLQMAELEAEPFGITIVRRLNDRIPKIVGDKEKLGQLFLNLIQNAIQAVPKKGKIVLESRVLAQGEVLEVSIVDDGPGIPEDCRSRVFDPFFTTKDGGTGLGLSICHTIVEQHQGSINIECGEETGTRVSVRLPVGQQE